MAAPARDSAERPARPRRLWSYLRTAMRLLLRRPIVGVGVVASLPGGEIVLTQRVDDGLWSLPGGMLDWGEEVAAAAARELAEETGLELLAIDRLVGVYSSPARDPRTHAVSIVVAARARGEPRIRDRMEVTAIRAFAPDALPFGSLAHDHERQLRDYLDGRTVVA